MRDIDRDAAARLLSASGANFLRRGADLSLSMSNARWCLVDQTPERFTFRVAEVAETERPSRPEDEMVLLLADVARITWDRLPKQEQRSQVRFHLHDGTIWTFSGRLDDTLLD